MFILKKGHQPGVYVPLRALFLVFLVTPNNQFRILTWRCCRVRAGQGAVVSVLFLQFWGGWFDAPFMQSLDRV